MATIRLENAVAALEHNTSVATLDLQYNKICPQTADQIAAALERSKAGVLVLTVSCTLQGPKKLPAGKFFNHYETNFGFKE